MTISDHEKKRINEIDLLRFLAALVVVLFHYSFRGYAADSMSVMPYTLLDQVSKYGYLGVQLFFMISGFVILKSASRGTLDSFVISRIVRLYPAFWVCCTITFLVTLVIGEPRYTVTTGQYLANMTMLSGFFGVPYIDGVYWTLLVEIKFYALVALVIYFGKINHIQTIIMFWLVVSVALVMYPISKVSYFLIVDYSSFFIAGTAFYLIWSRGVSITRILIVLASWALGTFQTINSLTKFESYYHVSMSRPVVVGIVTAFFLVMLLISSRRTGVIGKSNWMLVGVITYPLYLLHENIGFMIFNLVYPIGISDHLIFWGTIMVMVMLSYTVHVMIEKRYSKLLLITLRKLWLGINNYRSYGSK